MQEVGKILAVAGALIAVLGIIVMTAGKVPFIGRLPGDIVVERRNFTLYAPIATCLLLSLIVTVIYRLLGR